jgi:hypothetical protein
MTTLTKKNLLLNNVSIEYREEDNYINATQLCKAAGKEFKHWHSLISTKELIKSLENILEAEVVFPTTLDSSDTLVKSLVDIKKGNSKLFTQGSWIHPDLAVPLAQWLSPTFAIQVSRWIRELCITGSTTIDSTKTNTELIQLQKENAENKKLLLESQQEITEKNKLLLETQEALNAKSTEIKHKNIISSNDVKFNIRDKKEDESLYIGGLPSDLKNYCIKLGKSNFNTKRTASHSTATPEQNRFRMIKVYSTYPDLALPTEKYAQSLLDPLMIKTSVTRREHFITTTQFMDKMMQKLLYYQDDLVQDINKFITSVNENDYNFDLLNEEPYYSLNAEFNISSDTASDTASDTETNSVDEVESETAPEPEPEPEKTKKELMKEKEYESKNMSYYERVKRVLEPYKATLLTDESKLTSMTSKVDIQCSHGTRTIQLRTILKGIGCVNCIKDLKLAELTKTKKVDNFDNIEHLSLIDEETDEFKALKVTESNRKKTQNAIIKKLSEENIVLLTNYQNFDSKISICCNFKHKPETSWNALNKLSSNYCRICRDEVRKEKSITTTVKTDINELKEIAEKSGWVHIRKTGKAGLIEWECPNGHLVSKVRREIIRCFCAECSKAEK